MSKLIQKYDPNDNKLYLGEVKPDELHPLLQRKYCAMTTDLNINTDIISQVPLYFFAEGKSKYYVRFNLEIVNTGASQNFRFQFIHDAYHVANFSKMVITKNAAVAADFDRIIVESYVTGSLFINLNEEYLCRTLANGAMNNYFRIEGIIYNEHPCFIRLGIAKETPLSADIILKEHSFLVSEAIY